MSWGLYYYWYPLLINFVMCNSALVWMFSSQIWSKTLKHRSELHIHLFFTHCDAMSVLIWWHVNKRSSLCKLVKRDLKLNDRKLSWDNLCPGVGTPILWHGMEVPQWWPPFFFFFNLIGSLFIPQHDPINSIFLLKKIDLSLSHLVLEILGPKFGLLFLPKCTI